ncbi:MAG: hypothetical protein WDN28_18710 [Chthoniobacter sp.]
MIPFDSEDFDRVTGQLSPYVDFDDDGEVSDDPWLDDAAFAAWLVRRGIPKDVQDFLIGHLPRVSLAMNHGCLFGIQRFMEENGADGHQVWPAGFLIVGSGPNGDFIVVDIKEGAGRTGWLPMAMIWRMDAAETRDRFVATNSTLGQFMRASDEEWDAVPKDWYAARAAANRAS